MIERLPLWLLCDREGQGRLKNFTIKWYVECCCSVGLGHSTQYSSPPRLTICFEEHKWCWCFSHFTGFWTYCMLGCLCTDYWRMGTQKLLQKSRECLPLNFARTSYSVVNLPVTLCTIAPLTAEKMSLQRLLFMSTRHVNITSKLNSNRNGVVGCTDLDTLLCQALPVLSGHRS